MIFLLSGIFGILSFKIFSKIGIVFNGILLFGYFRSCSSDGSRYFGIIAYFAVIAFFTVYVFVLHSMTMAGRYILLTSILVLVFVSYFFEQMLLYCRKNEKTRTLIVVSILVIVNVLTGLFHSSNSKEYLKLLGEWTSQNISKSANLISNDTRLYYYSGRKVPFDRVTGAFHPIDVNERVSAGVNYALFRHESDDPVFRATTISDQLLKIKEGCNSKGNCAVLYKINGSGSGVTNKIPIGSQ